MGFSVSIKHNPRGGHKSPQGIGASLSRKEISTLGRIERKRWEGNDRAMELIKESSSRALTPDEIDVVKKGYTGYGGLTSFHNGQFFTPSVVTDFIVNMLALQEGDTTSILEPSCGAGAFFNVLPTTCSITGVEMMNEASAIASLCYPHVKVLKENTLEILPTLEDQFDFVVGNPPFMAMKHRPEFMGFDIATKLGKAEWYFLELAACALKPGGVCAYVVPDGILSNSKDLPGRKWLLESNWLRAVISLPAETFKHSGTGVKTSVLVFQKKVPGVELNDYSIFMGIVQEIGWDSRGRSTGKCDLPALLAEWRKFQATWTQSDEPETIQEEVIPLDLPVPPPAADSPYIYPAVTMLDAKLSQMAFDFGGAP